MKNKKPSCSRWMRERSPLEKTLLSFSFLLLITVILLILLGISIRGKEDDESTLCLSNECIQTASQILSKMEDSWNPCSHFYEYSCGGMNKSFVQTISTARGLHSVLVDLLETSTDKRIVSAKSVYKRCMDFSGLQEEGKKPDDVLRELMKKFEVGTWPVVDIFYDQDSQLNQDERLAGLSLLGIPVAFAMEVSYSNGSFSLKLSPGGPQLSGISEKEIRDDIKLETHLHSSFYLLGAPYTRATADAKDILSVDTYYAKVDQSVECNTVAYITPQESLKELRRLIPEYDWEVLINAVQKAAELTVPFAVELHCKEKIRDYIVFLNDLTERSAYNYIGWRFYSAFEKHIVPEFSHRRNSNSQRWMDCFALIEEYVSQPLTEALARHFIPHSIIQELENMVEDVDSTMQSYFPLRKKSKQVAELRKSLNHIKETFDSRTKKSTLPQVDATNYTSVVIDLRRQSVVKELQKLRNSTGEEYTASRNLLLQLLATEGIHFSKISKWFSYGSLGTMLSREFYKEFFQERCLDKGTGDCLPTIQLMPNLATNYSFIQEKEENLMKEILFDICGVEMAYESFKHSRSLTEEILPGIIKNEFQMFFIAYAQTFCKDEMKETGNINIKKRLNDFASKSSAFHEVFQCDSSIKPSFQCLTLSL